MLLAPSGPSQENHDIQNTLENLFNEWNNEISQKPFSLAIRLADKANTKSGREIVQLTRDPIQKDFFLHFAKNKIEEGHYDFSSIVMKVLQLTSSSLLKENESGISSEEAAKRVIKKIEGFINKKSEKLN